MQALPIAKERTCGGCQACCYSTTVWSKRHDLHSPAGARCPHQCATGCAIYGDHPSACSAFRCAWLDGWGTEADRPDRLGLVLEQLDRDALLVTQARAKAFRGRGRRVVQALARSFGVIVLGEKHGDEPAFVGPGAERVIDHAYRRMQEAAAHPEDPFVALGDR